MLAQSDHNSIVKNTCTVSNKYFTVINDSSIAIDIYVQPGSRVSLIVGIHGELLKIKVGAPPLDSRANDAVIRVLSLWLGVCANKINIVRGEKSRLKRVIINLINDNILSRLEEIYNVQ